jgi:3-hydroxy-9,10-secoandrosta-1,3,5(10)-triene-9,17-dione monooxygenase
MDQATAASTTIPVPEPDLTPREIVARAAAMRPKLLELQAETEERTFYSAETHREFTEAGFYRILQPRRFGGYEFDMPTYFRVVIEIARGCPSTGWCLCLGGAHVLQIASMYSEQAQQELFGPDGHFVCASFGFPVGVAEPQDGGYLLEGTWPYASGIPYSTHFMGQTLLHPEVDLQVEGGTVGSRLHGNPMYAGRSLGFFHGELAAIMVGAAYAALDEYERTLSKPFTWGPMMKRSELEHYQRYLGEAIAEIGVAEAAAIQGAEQWMELARQNVEEGRPFTARDDARLEALQATAARVAWHAVEGILFRTGGSGSARNGQRMQRYWRDMSTYWSHNTPAQRDLLLLRLGRMQLGLPLDLPGMLPVRENAGG